MAGSVKIDLIDSIRYDFVNDKYSLSNNRDNNSSDELTLEQVTRYYKGMYGSKGRFERAAKNLTSHVNKGIKDIMDTFDHVEPFSGVEAFKIKNETFQTLVFQTVDINDMIENVLGHERYKTEGRHVNTKIFDDEGNFVKWEEKHNVFEVHKVYGQELNIRDFYAVKCWCTSTNEQHWVYIQDQYKEDPLEAIASTFRVYEDIIPYIKEIKRQGDVLITEMTDEWQDDFVPKGKVVALDKETYFNLLTCET